MDTGSTPFSPENNLFHTDPKQLENQYNVSLGCNCIRDDNKIQISFIVIVNML